MHNSNIPSDRDVPPTAKLIKSTIIAAVVAAILLVTVVMPAEYGIDPTGIGSVIGLKRMGEIKMSLAKESEATTPALEETTPALEEMTAKAISKAKPDVPAKVLLTEAITSTPSNSTPINSHEMTFILAPDEAAEIKVVLAKGAAVDYVWEADGDAINFDVHGDSNELNISYHPYYKGSDKKREGTLVADFDGTHGWFWRNRTGETSTITLSTSGEYSDIIRY